MQKFIDDEIEHKESDIEKIQTKPNMYISYLGRKGTLHLAKELINNAIDECINPNSPGDEIDIYVDETENSVMVSDNGRGFPFDKMEIACTKLQAGSKFYREGVGGTAGENGVGLTAVNALGEYFEIISRRYGETASIKFEKGELVQPLKVKKTGSDKHGTTVKFKPNPYFMDIDQEDCQIPTEELMKWLGHIIALVPPKIKITLSVNRKGKESSINKKYQNKDGLYSVCKKLVKKPALDPIHFMKSMKFVEKTKNQEFDRFIGLEVAFTLSSTPNTEMVAESFCNFVHTVEHGVHVDAVRTGIVQYLTKAARDSLSEREAKKIDIVNHDVINSLVLAVYLSTNMQPHFASQTKEKATNPAFFKPLRDMTYRSLEEHFKKNPKDLKKLVDVVKANAKARIEATKVRNSVIRGETTSLDEHEISNFYPANNRGRNSYRELFIIEGESASGTADQARFNDFQALFALRGVPLNAFGLKLDRVLDNEEFKNLVRVLGCNIGEKFNENDCRYKKIIIMTDSDVDGYRIFSLVCAFFLVHLPELVKKGYLYKAVAPLYRIKDKKKKFVRNKQEYIEVFERRIGDNVRLIDPKTGVVMKDAQLQEFLLRNREYLDELHRVSSHYGIHREIIEFIAIHSGSDNFEKKFKKKFPELTIDSEGVLSGIYEGRYQILTMDKLFTKRLEALKDLIFNVNEGKVYYLVHEKNGNEYIDRGIMSIGGFLSLCQKFQPEIDTRFKGLGELDADELMETTLDPNNRILIKLTVEDMEREMEKFRILHGDSADERKMLMEHYKISRENLDN